MRIAAYALSVLLASSLSSAPGPGQDTKSRSSEGKESMFSTREHFAKGGIGLINEHLYIDLKSPTNSLIVKPTPEKEDRWKGRSASKREVVIFYDGKVWLPQDLPDHFDLSNAVVVSFEGSKVRFFDFHAMSGGYYRRASD